MPYRIPQLVSFGRISMSLMSRPVLFTVFLIGASLPVEAQAYVGPAARITAVSQPLRNVALIYYDQLCRSPKAGLAELLAAVGPVERTTPAGLSSRLHASTSYGDNDLDVPPELLWQARDLHAALGARALNDSH